MQINIAAERLLSLRQAAALMPSRRGERPVSATTIWRWHRAGKNGVRLEALETPGGLVTSVEALQRFIEGLSSVGRAANETRPRVVCNVDRELDRRGIR